MTWKFHVLLDSGSLGTSSLQAIPELFTNCGVKRPSNFVYVQAISKDWLSLISRVAELTYQLTNTKETCLHQRKNHVTGITPLRGLVSQQILLLQLAADILTNVSDAVDFLAASLKHHARKLVKFPRSVMTFYQRRKTGGADEGRYNLGEKTAQETRGVLV